MRDQVDRREPAPIAERMASRDLVADRPSISEDEALRRMREPKREPKRDDDVGRHDAEPLEDEEPEQRTFRGVRDAHEALRQDVREASELKRKIADRKAREAEDEAHAEVHRASSWSEHDRGLYGEYQNRVAQYNASAQQVGELQRLIKSNPDASPTLKQGLVSAVQQLAQEHQLLSNGPRVIQQKQQAKVRATAEAVLHKAVPQLKDRDNQRRLATWLKRQGVTEENIAAETNPQVVALAWRRMVEQEKAEAEQKQRQERAQKSAAFAQRHLRRGTEVTPENAKEARARLRRSGSMDDALGVLKMRAIERGAAR